LKILRHSIALIISGLLWIGAPGVASAGDDFVAPKDPLPSRLPLLDESALDKYSTPSPSPPAGAHVDEEYPPNSVIPLDTKNLRYFSYFAKIERRIKQSFYYPKAAAEDFLNGIVTVSFEINRNGSLGELKIIGSSGKEVLDEAALAIIQRAAPFSTIPSRIKNEPLTVVTRLRFIPTQEAIQQRDGLNLFSIPID
jgi:TonB family protein